MNNKSDLTNVYITNNVDELEQRENELLARADNLTADEKEELEAITEFLQITE